MKTILVADCSHPVRRRVKALVASLSPQYRIIDAVSCKEVLRLLSAETVHYAIFDLLLEDDNIFIHIRELAGYFRHTRVLIYSAMPEQIYGKRLISKGAKGYLSKEAGITELHHAVNTLLKDHTYISGTLIEHFFRKTDDRADAIDSLSDRELQIVGCLAMSMDAAQIARKLNMAHSSVKIYQKRILRKMGVQNTDELASWIPAPHINGRRTD